MREYLESLTILIAPTFAKKNNLRAGQAVTVRGHTENLYYPACIRLNKKCKTDKKIHDNGCIPNELREKKFSIEPGYKWLYAESMTFILFKKINLKSKIANESEYCASPEDQENSTDIVLCDIMLSELTDVKNICQFIKKELLKNHSICLKADMKICLHYLTQKLIFIVKEIKPCYYGVADKPLPSTNFAFKCYEDTQIDIRKKEESVTTVHRLCFDSFGGYRKQIQDLKENVSKFFAGKSSVSGILIAGNSGVGKSFIGSIMMDMYKDKCNLYRAEDLLSIHSGETEANLRTIFEKAHTRSPSIIFIDDIDQLCSSKEQSMRYSGILNALLHLMDGVQNSQANDSQVFVIATATKPNILDAALRRPGRLSHDIVLTPPSEEERLDILQCIFKEFSSIPSREILNHIVAKTPGFVAADLEALVTDAFSRTEELLPSLSEISQALDVVKPSSLKDVPVQSYKVSFEEDVIGYEAIKDDLKTTFDLNLHRKHLFASNDITLPSRILLFGPSGCGKSWMVYALASKFNLFVIPVKRSNVFGKYFGESEKNLGALFEQAQKCSPCILHFENFDGIAGKGSKSGTESCDAESRILNHLKVVLDGVVEYENIFVLAETNRPDLLDKDVIRHGRFHKYLFFDLPSSEERRLILIKNLSHYLVEKQDNELLCTLIERTRGYSVLEIIRLCKEILSILRETYADTSIVNKESLSLPLIEEALESVKPSNTSKLMRRYREFHSVFS